VGGSGTLLYLASSLLEAIVDGCWSGSRWVDVVLQWTRRRCERVQRVEWSKKVGRRCVSKGLLWEEGSRLYEELSGRGSHAKSTCVAAVDEEGASDAVCQKRGKCARVSR
jgi:hypothetical protein